MRAPLASRRTLPAPAVLALALLLGAACGGGSGQAGEAPGPAVNCRDDAQLVVTNEQALRVRVVERSTIEPPRIIGEIPGRGTRTFPVRQVVGVYYTVEIIDTGELLAAEPAHPRGAVSRGARLERRCV